MIDSLLVANLAAFCVQLAFVATVATAVAAIVRVESAAVRHAYWRVVLALCLSLPWWQRRRSLPSGTAGVDVSVAPFELLSQSATAAGSWDWPVVLIALLLAGIALRALWLAVGLWRLRRVHRTGEPAAHPEHEHWQRALGTSAEVRYIADLRQPVTFGLRRPVVLLPEGLRAQAEEIREAVIVHELFHVRRRDWIWVVVEELARSALWFHPAAWWLVSRVQLSREEVVDDSTVRITGRRPAYVRALLLFAEQGRAAWAPAFARRRQLFRRILLVSREVVMSPRRLFISGSVLALVVALGTWFAVDAFPLRASERPQLLQTQAGPLERSARAVTPENPVPRRVHYEPAPYPSEAAQLEASARVSLKVTLDASGRVGELRLTTFALRVKDVQMLVSGDDAMERLFSPGASLKSADGSSLDPSVLRPVISALVNAASSAVSQWRYDPPAAAPLAFEVTIRFAPEPRAAGVAPMPGPPGGWDGTLRVGGKIAPPAKIKDVRPVYPQEALDSHTEGVVVLELRIEPDGRVGDARVLRSIPLLDQAALDAARQWEFAQTLLNGVPTPVVTVVTINFTLR